MKPTLVRPAASRRGTVAVAVVIALVMLQLVVVGIVISGARDHDLNGQHAHSARAFYAAEAGVNMALAEIYSNTDRDSDGTIGSISADGALGNDPFLGATNFVVTPLPASSGRKFGSQGRGGGTLSRCEFSVSDFGAAIEGFQLYGVGVALNNVGGWFPWDDNAAVVAYTTGTIARTGGRSCDILSTSDSVHLYTAASGQWTYTAWQYIPADATGTDAYLILMNTYASNGPKSWSTQVRFQLSDNTVYDNLVGGVTGNVLTLIRDAWVPISVQVDLDAGTQTVSYNDQLLFAASWNRLGGVGAIAAVDLFGSTASHVYYDDLQLSPAAGFSSKITAWTMAPPEQ